MNNEIYKRVINLLKLIDLTVKNPDEHKILRKEILDLANDIKRSGEKNDF